MLTDNVRGAILMTVSMGAFVINDTMMKVTFETLPVPQVIFFRGLFASMLLILMAAFTGALSFRPPRRDFWPLVFRCIGEIGGTASFMMALANTPIANAVAVLQAAPLFVTMAAALFFNETVGWRRWSAIGVGFIGMLIIVQPGAADFDAYVLFAVLTVLFIVGRDLATRNLSRSTPAVWASALSAMVVTCGAGLLVPIEGWQPMGSNEIMLALGASVFVIIGYITQVGSVRFGDISAVAPFRYTVLIFAMILGFLVFGEVPGWLTIFGAVIVCGAGLYTIWRERARGITIAASAPSRPFVDGIRGPAREP